MKSESVKDGDGDGDGGFGGFGLEGMDMADETARADEQGVSGVASISGGSRRYSYLLV